MNKPTWYMPALADVTLNAMNDDAIRGIDNVHILKRLGTLSADGQSLFNAAMELHTLIEQEKAYRQTVRLHEAAQQSQPLVIE